MKLPILHLSDGNHHFEEVIGSGTLNFNRQEMYPNPLNIQADVNKFENNLQCAVTLDTKALYTCDRCLSEYYEPIQIQFQLLFHLGKKLESDEDDVINLKKETVEVDLNTWIIEQLILAIPMKMVCNADCKGICPGCGAELNNEECRCTKENIDPRLEKLRELLK